MLQELKLASSIALAQVESLHCTAGIVQIYHRSGLVGVQTLAMDGSVEPPARRSVRAASVKASAKITNMTSVDASMIAAIVSACADVCRPVFLALCACPCPDRSAGRGRSHLVSARRLHPGK